eukprot:COSAG02_NODE_38777_length_425_cov_0.699387_1_plen_57_part_10
MRGGLVASLSAVALTSETELKNGCALPPPCRCHHLLVLCPQDAPTDCNSVRCGCRTG